MMMMMMLMLLLLRYDCGCFFDDALGVDYAIILALFLV